MLELAFPVYIDNSMLNIWRACKHKHLWSTLFSLYPRGYSIHLTAGGALAAALEAARKYAFKERVEDFETLRRIAYPAFLEAWGDYIEDPNSPKSFVHTWAAFEAYIKRWPPLSDVLQPWIRPNGEPAIEYKFAIPLEDFPHPETGDPILFVGRFDMIGQMEAGNKLLIGPADEKSTGNLAYNWHEKWGMRGQFIGYGWALRQQGIPATTAFVRGIAIQKTQTPLDTAIISIPEHLFTRWEKQLYFDLHSMIAAYNELKEFPELIDEHYPYAFGDACESYGGCAFLDLCTAAQPHSFFSNYQRFLFNPIEGPSQP